MEALPALPRRVPAPRTRASTETPQKQRRAPPKRGVRSATHPVFPSPPGPPWPTPGARAAAPRCGGAGDWPACVATWREGRFESPRVAYFIQPSPGVRKLHRPPQAGARMSQQRRGSAEQVDLSRALTADWPRAKAPGSQGSAVHRPAARTYPELVRNADSRAPPQTRCIRICILTSSPGDSRAH